MKKISKFNPYRTAPTDKANWIRAGDFEEAKSLAYRLATLLDVLAANGVAQRELLKGGAWIEIELLKLIAERLRADPSVNKEAQEEFHDLIRKGDQMGKLKMAAEKIKQEPSKGKTRRTGAEIFAEVLVPNKPTKPQFEVRWFAAVADLNLQSTTKEEYKRVAAFINTVIEKNNKLLADWKQGKSEGLSTEHSHVIPKRRITPDQLEKAYRKFKAEIDKSNGLYTHRIK